jgi:hypothetical protein
VFGKVKNSSLSPTWKRYVLLINYTVPENNGRNQPSLKFVPILRFAGSYERFPDSGIVESQLRTALRKIHSSCPNIAKEYYNRGFVNVWHSSFI